MKGTKIKLTQKRLKEVLDYDPKTGVFIWKQSGSGRRKTLVAGCKHNGYIRIKIDDNKYSAHRLAWLYTYGYLPEYRLDHKDRIRDHNWIDNLREASNQCNMRNCGNPKDNTSGVKGISLDKRDGKWQAYIIVNQKHCHLGCYKSFDEAVCARLAGEQAYNWESCDSSSPAYKYVKKYIQIKEAK